MIISLVFKEIKSLTDVDSLDSELVFDYEKDFYDDMHTTPLGSEKIGKYLYEKLKHLNFSSD